MSEVSRVQEPEPRRWPIGSTEPKEDGLRVQSTQNHVIFRRGSYGQWQAERTSGGDGEFYSWHAINSDYAEDGGMEVVEVLPAAEPTPLNPVLAEKLQKYGLAKCVYAAAYDIEPWTVDDTDGGYGDVCELIAEDWNATLEPLALALGMPDDSDYAAILQQVAKLAREVSRG